MSYQTYEYEYTDTSGGDANYCWVKRGKVDVPELTHYGYDGLHGYSKANKAQRVQIMRKVKADLCLTGIRGTIHEYGDMIEFRPYGIATVLFITYCECDT